MTDDKSTDPEAIAAAKLANMLRDIAASGDGQTGELLSKYRDEAILQAFTTTCAGASEFWNGFVAHLTVNFKMESPYNPEGEPFRA